MGSLSVGFLLDDAFAGQLKQITGKRDRLRHGRPDPGHYPRARCPPGALALLRQRDGNRNVTIGAEEYVVLPLPLARSTDATGLGGGAVALILRSRTDQLRVLQQIHTELGVIAVWRCSWPRLLSFAVARTITRPLATITGVMRDVAATGDLTRKIVLRHGQRWDDEDARLLATTFNTLTDSVAQAQREISQRERLSSLGRLSTVIAHEVRNPLMIIKAALHTLRQPDNSAAAVREAAADIDGEVARLNRIVNEVLDFARPIRFELAPADVNAVCRESATAAQASPGPRSISSSIRRCR
jgi:signal transduction histidine kinase